MRVKTTKIPGYKARYVFSVSVCKVVILKEAKINVCTFLQKKLRHLLHKEIQRIIIFLTFIVR